ncbi:MAG: hypothetical protein INQ03_10765 [Candidatus Heimdallarchaeota archaeon]|nr:hypothetical protein [Candidatus Heimdallarchaeota archaeon]
MFLWTQEVIISIISLIPVLIGNYIVILALKKHKNNFIIIFSYAWTSYTLFRVFESLSILLQNIYLYKLCNNLSILALINIVLAYEYLAKDRIRNVVIAILMIFSTLIVYVQFTEPTVESYLMANGDPSFTVVGNMRVFTMIMALYATAVFCFYNYKIWVNSPVYLKFYTKLNLLGSIIFGPLYAIFFATGLTTLYPVFAYSISPIGVITSAYAIYKRPEIVYILPFQLIQLNVIQGNTGLSVYSHYWSEKSRITSDEIFSSVIEAMKSFTEEMLNVGGLKMIILQQGVLVLEEDQNSNFYFVLLASKINSFLIQSLGMFTTRFSQCFADRVQDDFVLDETIVKTEADEILDEVFKYIPKL